MKKIVYGDRIAIQVQGRLIIGSVESAEDYGNDGGWYIEMTRANVPGGYSYWKQGSDGGKIVQVNGVNWEEVK
jgi:hypothetical protein